MTENQKLREALQAISDIDDSTNHAVDASAALDRIGQIARQALALPTAGKMINGLTQTETDASASVSGLTAAPVGEREAFEQIIVHRIGSRAIERWNDDPDAEYKNSRVEDLRGGWIMHLQWQARAALSAGDAVDAQRYRWLADCLNYPEAVTLISDGSLTEEALGKAIDAAMRKGQL